MSEKLNQPDVALISAHSDLSDDVITEMLG